MFRTLSLSIISSSALYTQYVSVMLKIHTWVYLLVYIRVNGRSNCETQAGKILLYKKLNL